MRVSQQRMQSILTGCRTSEAFWQVYIATQSSPELIEGQAIQRSFLQQIGHSLKPRWYVIHFLESFIVVIEQTKNRAGKLLSTSGPNERPQILKLSTKPRARRPIELLYDDPYASRQAYPSAKYLTCSSPVPQTRARQRPQKLGQGHPFQLAGFHCFSCPSAAGL
jgi:hypothetical protein